MKRAWYGLLMMLMAGSTFADEILHCALFDFHSAGGGGGHPLLREQMKRMKGKTSPPRAGEQIFRDSREADKDNDTGFFTYHGKLSISGKTRWEFNNWFNRATPRRDLFDSGITVGVSKSPDAATQYSFDIDYLDKSAEGDYFRVQTTGLPVPVRRNEWIEVGRFGHSKGNNFSCQLWIYLETPDPVGPAEPPLAPGVDQSDAYRLDIIFGALPEATVRTMHTFGQEHTRLTAMAIQTWETYSVICRSEKPFRFDAGMGELSKIRNPGTTAGCVTQVEGEIRVDESGLTLNCQIQPQVERGKKAMKIHFSGDLVPDTWKLQEVANGPKMGEFYPQRDPGIVNRDNSFVNVVAYRIAKP